MLLESKCRKDLAFREKPRNRHSSFYEISHRTSFRLTRSHKGTPKWGLISFWFHSRAQIFLQESNKMLCHTCPAYAHWNIKDTPGFVQNIEGPPCPSPMVRVRRLPNIALAKGTLMEEGDMQKGALVAVRAPLQANTPPAARGGNARRSTEKKEG